MKEKRKAREIRMFTPFVTIHPLKILAELKATRTIQGLITLHRSIEHTLAGSNTRRVTINALVRVISTVPCAFPS